MTVPYNPLDPELWREMALVIHETHLFFAVHAASCPTKVDVFIVPLSSATCTRRTARTDAPSDDGFDIGGFGPEPAAAVHFMPLGAGPEAEACLSATKAAIDAAKTPAA